MTTARLVLTAALPAVVGCSPGGEAAGSRAGMVTYGNHDCLPARNEDFTVGEHLGTARVAECDDTPDAPEVAVPEGTTDAYPVEGRDPAEAIAVGDTPSGARLMEAG